jgi:hypothetical protein
MEFYTLQKVSRWCIITYEAKGKVAHTNYNERGNALRTIGFLLVITALLMMPLPLAPAASADDAGSVPDNPIDMAGTMSGTLAAGEHCWYRFSSSESPGGVLMTYSPVTFASAKGAGFYVGYYVRGLFGDDWLTVGEGTQLGSTPGHKYWRGDTGLSHVYLLNVQNLSPDGIDYAIAFTGDVYPPPSITFNPDNKQPSYGGWPATKPAPTPVIEGGGPSQEKAVPIEGDFATGVLSPYTNSWVSFRTRGRGENTTVRMKVIPFFDEANQALFKVWSFLKTPTGYTLTEVGRGYRGDNLANTKSWRGGGDRDATYYLEIINGTAGTVRWEIKLDNYNPYWR